MSYFLAGPGSNLGAALGGTGVVVMDFLLRATLVMIVTLAAMALLHRRSAALRHLIGLVGVAGLLALPLAALILPADLALLPSLRGWLLGGSTSGGAAPTIPWAGIRTGLVLVWLLGGLLFLGRFLKARHALQGFFRRARRVESLTEPLAEASRALGQGEAAVHLGVSSEVDVPLTFGLTSPRILLPASSAQWSAERLEMVLLHELAHVRRLDMVNQCVCLAACCLFWFHPLVWVLSRRLDLERERACDDLVLSCRGDAVVYARQLVDIAESLRGRPISAFGVSMARPSQLRRRLTALLDGEVDRRGTSLLQGVAAIALGVAVILPLGALAPGGVEPEAWETESASETMEEEGWEGEEESNRGHGSGHGDSGRGHSGNGHSGHASGDHSSARSSGHGLSGNGHSGHSGHPSHRSTS